MSVLLLLGFLLLWESVGTNNGVYAESPEQTNEEQTSDCFFVLMSDPHQGWDIQDQSSPLSFSGVCGKLLLYGKSASAKEQRFYRACKEIVAMNPRPAMVLILGDLAFQIGTVRDYQIAKRSLNLLDEAGIPWQTTMGNHDRQEDFLAVFPEKRLDSDFIPGQMTQVVKIGDCDILLLDTHTGKLDQQTCDWLQQQVDNHNGNEHPFMVMSHHPLFAGHTFNDHPAKVSLENSPFFWGYAYGHLHQWKANCQTVELSPHFRWVIAVPSLAYPGGIEEPLGYLVVRLEEERGVSVELKDITESFRSE